MYSVAKKKSGKVTEIIEVDREVLLSMLRRIENLERKLNEMETKFAQKV